MIKFPLMEGETPELCDRWPRSGSEARTSSSPSASKSQSLVRDKGSLESDLFKHGFIYSATSLPDMGLDSLVVEGWGLCWLELTGLLTVEDVEESVNASGVPELTWVIHAWTIWGGKKIGRRFLSVDFQKQGGDSRSSFCSLSSKLSPELSPGPAWITKSAHCSNPAAPMLGCISIWSHRKLQAALSTE
jgi:hypothetical protein